MSLRRCARPAEHLRLLSASFMFVSLERAARDAGQSLGRRIAFVTSGGEVRLDAQVFGAVQSALVQAVRNAVAHGIESTAERGGRRQAGGGPRVPWKCGGRGHQAVFVCRDDGRGIDLEAVRRAVAAKGLRPADAAKLGTEELLRRLLSGGLTTSPGVSQLAGRGIGLDVVREAAARLRGEVSIRTDQGTGYDIGNRRTGVAGGRRCADRRSRRTHRRHSIGCGQADPAGCAGRSGASPRWAPPCCSRAAQCRLPPLERALRSTTQSRDVARSWSAVVIEGANSLAAVESGAYCAARRNLVLRPLPEFTPGDPVVAGASLDAEGHPQLVLDPQGLVEHVCRTGPVLAATHAPRAPILVIDDSLTTRMLEQSILESAGYEVDLATSGEDGLERALKRRYALFLVDVEMPGMDGFTFIERTRKDPGLRDIPAILVTSRASPEDRQRGQSVGARAYIVKGEFDQTELLEKIRLLAGMQ